jgi:hypothetical protein
MWLYIDDLSPLGNTRPELTGFSSPFMGYAAFLPKSLTLPVDPITTTTFLHLILIL